MQANVVKIFHFEAGHQLPHHNGKCASPHGHSYKLEIGIKGSVHQVRDDPESYEGMVLDFQELTDVWHKVLEPQLDHKWLNDILLVPTAELITHWILEKVVLSDIDFDPTDIVSVRLWETESSYAEASTIIDEYGLVGDTLRP